jgi:hypothetical protein
MFGSALPELHPIDSDKDSNFYNLLITNPDSGEVDSLIQYTDEERNAAISQQMALKLSNDEDREKIPTPDFENALEGAIFSVFRYACSSKGNRLYTYLLRTNEAIDPRDPKDLEVFKKITKKLGYAGLKQFYHMPELPAD